MFVRDAMVRNVPTIRIDKKLAAARSIMDWAGINQLPVVDQQGDLLGLVTRDSMRAAVPLDKTMLKVDADRKFASTPVSNAIVFHTPSVRPDTKAWEAAQLMTEYQVTVLPVVDGTRIAGMISASDLVEHAGR